MSPSVENNSSSSSSSVLRNTTCSGFVEISRKKLKHKKQCCFWQCRSAGADYVKIAISQGQIAISQGQIV